MIAKIRVRGDRDGLPVRGQDVGVVVVIDGMEVLLPCRSLVLNVGARSELVTATVVLDVHDVDLVGLDADITKLESPSEGA